MVLITELVTRIIYKDKFNRYLPYCINFQPDSLIGFTYEANSSFVINHTQININNKGFIGNNFTNCKKRGTYRIIFVGACGISGVTHLNFYANFCTTLQYLFDKNGWNVEIINCGIDGDHRSYEDFNIIKQKVLDYNPDLIIAESNFPFISFNYTREVYRGNLMEYPMNNYKLREELKTKIDELFKSKYKLLFFLYDHSYTIKALHNYFWHKGYFTPLTEILFLHYCRRFTNLNGRPKYWTVEKSTDMMKALNNELRLKGINLFYFSYVKDIDNINYFKDHQLPLISLFNREEFTPSMFYFDDSHFSSVGYKTIGERFFHILTENALIPPSFNNKHN